MYNVRATFIRSTLLKRTWLYSQNEYRLILNSQQSKQSSIRPNFANSSTPDCQMSRKKKSNNIRSQQFIEVTIHVILRSVKNDLKHCTNFLQNSSFSILHRPFTNAWTLMGDKNHQHDNHRSNSSVVQNLSDVLRQW